MIQRIQSVFLLVAFLLLETAASVLYVLPEVDLGGFRLFFAAAEAMVGIAALVAIFLYGNRARQARLVGGVRILNLLVIAVLFYVLFSTDGWTVLAAAGVFRITGVLLTPVVALLALHLARRGIDRDIDLIRSMDRLR